MLFRWIWLNSFLIYEVVLSDGLRSHLTDYNRQPSDFSVMKYDDALFNALLWCYPCLLVPSLSRLYHFLLSLLFWPDYWYWFLSKEVWYKLLFLFILWLLSIVFYNSYSACNMIDLIDVFCLISIVLIN